MKKIITTLILSLLLCSLWGSNPRKADKKAEVFNVGISGNTTRNLKNRLDKDLLSLHPDVTIIVVGTNDMLNSRKFIDLAEYETNLNYIVRQLRKSKSRVVLMSPPPVDTAYLFTRHKRDAFEVAPNAKLDSVRMIMHHLGQQKKVEYFDLHQVFLDKNVPQHNTDLYIRNVMNSNKTDGVHPTAKGYHLIAESLFAFLSENKLIKKDQLIACFGDSITYGAGSKGGGTVQGENYPSYLNQMIQEQ